MAADSNKARQLYGPELTKPSSDPSFFPPRQSDVEDYPAGEEPWIAGFLRQWALEYEKDYGEMKEGWGEWSKKKGGLAESWEWPVKRIITHRIQADESVQYLVKWIGRRFEDSWVTREELGDEAVWKQYDETQGLAQPSRAASRSTRSKKRKR